MAVRKLLSTTIRIFDTLFFDPVSMMNKWRGLPFFIKNLAAYKRQSKDHRFGLQLKDMYPVLQDRFAAAGGMRGHYFFQDLWAARELFHRQVKDHVDVGSRLDGFIAHLLTFTSVTYIDIRPVDVDVEGLDFKSGSITSLPYPDQSLASLSCLHVIEHIGLGRYGDPIDPDGYLKAAKELARVLAPGCVLLLGVPVGKERLCFDAHRVFDPQTIVDAFGALTMKGFSLIDDDGDRIHLNASFEKARDCNYGCGLFVFENIPCC